MSGRVTTLLASGLAVFSVGLFVVFVVLAPGAGDDAGAVSGMVHWLDELPNLAVMTATALVGAFIAAKRPRNPVGWLMCMVGLGFAAYPVVVVIAASVPGDPSWVYLVAWVGSWVWVLGHAGAIFLLVLFPSGRLLSPFLWPFAVLAGALLLAVLLGAATFPGPMESAPRLENPFGLSVARLVIPGLIPVIIPLQVLACGLLILRFRRSRGEERQQMKWVALGSAVLASSFALVFVGVDLPGWTEALASAAVLAAVAIAILRHRLYDIDVIINQTLVYAALTAVLVLVYVGSVFSLQYLFRMLTVGAGLKPAPTVVIVASTLAIAALFNPLRRRIQAFVDRRFYRHKYDARKTLEEFGIRLRDETDLDRLGNELVGVVRETLQPTRVSLWMRGPEER